MTSEVIIIVQELIVKQSSLECVYYLTKLLFCV